jgi:acyl dehydratase
LRDVTVSARFIKPVFMSDYVRLEAVRRSDGKWDVAVRHENRVTVIEAILVLAPN